MHYSPSYAIIQASKHGWPVVGKPTSEPLLRGRGVREMYELLDRVSRLAVGLYRRVVVECAEFQDNR